MPTPNTTRMTEQNKSDCSRRGKKVGFAPNLTTYENGYESHSPGNERPVWDSETDHILSYFLDGDTQLNAGIPEFPNADPLQHYAGADHSTTTTAAASSASTHHQDDMFPGMDILQATCGTATEQKETVGLPNSDDEEDEDYEPIAPPTPKIPQFYAGQRSLPQHEGKVDPSTRPQSAPPAFGAFPATGATTQNSSMDMQGLQSAIPSSGSSSSSSLSTMANTLVSGGPMLFHQIQQQQQMYASMMAMAQQQQQQHFAQAPSPVSPAAMIGTPENLMLPPPPLPGQSPVVQSYYHHQPGYLVYQNAAAQSAAAVSNLSGSVVTGPSPGAMPPPSLHAAHPALSPASQQQHMAWLRGLNAMAKAGQRGSQEVTPSRQQEHQQQPGVPQPYPLQPSMPLQPGPTSMGPSIHPAAAAHFGIPFTAFPNMTFYGHAAAAAASALQQSKNPAPEESEEKRAKRLERNRESARKSRRRKKERLAAVEAQVAKLYQKIAVERDRQIEKLVPGLRKLRIQKLEQSVHDAGENDAAAIMTLIRQTGPDSPVFQAVLEFQSNYLQANLFPRYQKLWLWLALNEENYFLAGKDEYIKRDPDRLVVRTSSGKISSKQIGDELTNGPPAAPDSKRPAHKQGVSDDVTRTSQADDAARTWPLFCYEHQFSVDQEEKFMALHKKLGQKHDLKASWEKSKASMRACGQLRDAMEFVTRVASNREERTLVGVLKVDQILTYRQWIVMNHERCSRSLQNRQQQLQSFSRDYAQHFEPGEHETAASTAASPASRTGTPQSSSLSESLQDVCLRLEQVIRLSRNDRL